MGRIAETFGNLRTRGEKALVAYVTGGDPSLADLPRILEALAEGGADLIEVGLPFSDPIADGPTIQASSQRALDSGTTASDLLAAVSGFDKVPVILMGYMNTLLRGGLDKTANRFAESGIAGVIVCDATPEECRDWTQVARGVNIDTVFLAAPTSTDDRLQRVCEASTGFVYAVSRTGVTGVTDQGWAQAETLVGRLRQKTSLPVCVGFGIGDAPAVRDVCRFADGAIVGSKIVDLLASSWEQGSGKSTVVEFVRSLKEATR